jgi:hypothetical protein
MSFHHDIPKSMEDITGNRQELAVMVVEFICVAFYSQDIDKLTNS